MIGGEGGGGGGRQPKARLRLRDLGLYKSLISGRAEEAKDLEAGADWRTLRGEDDGTGQALNLLREPGLEGLQVHVSSEQVLQ
jgi:hypothetical protein